jgi:hypothetical protein
VLFFRQPEDEPRVPEWALPQEAARTQPVVASTWRL